MTESNFYMTSKTPGSKGALLRKDGESPINEEIRALYEKYGEEGDIPDHLLALAKEIEDAQGERRADGEGQKKPKDD